MHVKRTVGYVQITIAVILVFFAFSFIFSYYENTAGVVIQMESNAPIMTEAESYLAMQNTASWLLNTQLIAKASLIIFIALALLMFFEGVSKTRLGTNDDVAPRTLGMFISIVIGIVSLVTVTYLLIVGKPTGFTFGLWAVLAFFNWLVFAYVYEKVKHTKHLNKHVGLWLGIGSFWTAYLLVFMIFFA